MKKMAIILTALILIGLAVPLVSCSSESGEVGTMENQIVTVQRGNLIIDITAVGNLALSLKEDLAFEISGTVEEVMVEEGDTVEEGQELVKLDTSEWDKQLKALEKALTTSERNLTTKERDLIRAEDNVTTKERDLTRAERQVTSKELAVRQAQLDLQTVENNVSQIADVKKAQDAIDNAEYALKFAKSMLSGEFGGGVKLSDYSYWSLLATNAQDELTQAEKDLQEIKSDSSIKLSSDVALEVAKSQLQVEQSQMQLEAAKIAVEDAEQAVNDARLAVDDAKIAVNDARLVVEDAQQTVEDAQSDLDEAKSLSPVITAPFAGFVAKVHVEGGDEPPKGTVAVQLADPNKFEAEIMVSEMDIMQVNLEGDASVQVDAVQGLSLPAKVTHIAPTATIQQGVVNYRVKVEVQSLEAVQQERQEARQRMTQDISSGQLPERIQQAIEEGRMTQEQAEAMMKQMQQGQAGQQRQVSTAIPENFQLREGLTVTVSIIVDERNDVLLVPNAAITTQGNQTFVQVPAADGTLEQRAIQTGISDYQFTEVIEGLAEGEQIIVPEGTAATPTTQQQRRPGGIVPGMGGMPH